MNADDPPQLRAPERREAALDLLNDLAGALEAGTAPAEPPARRAAAPALRGL